jgi:predicted nuclease of predicted toxin-antitoxin system
MRILLDESLPRKLASELPGHETQTVQKRGGSGLKNGQLLQVASREFQVLLTGDRNLEFQQNVDALQIAVVVLVAVNNRIETLRARSPREHSPGATGASGFLAAGSLRIASNRMLPGFTSANSEPSAAPIPEFDFV